MCLFYKDKKCRPEYQAYFLGNFPLLAQHLETCHSSQQLLQWEVTWGGVGKGGSQGGNVSSEKTVIFFKISWQDEARHVQLTFTLY